MNELHKFKLDKPFFDEEFIETEEFGPYLQSVKDAYEPYGLFNIPQFGANNIFEEDEILTLNESNQIASEEDKKTHEVVISEFHYENDGTPVWTLADLSFDNEVEENIYGFIKDSMEPLKIEALMHIYYNLYNKVVTAKDFADKMAAWIDWKNQGEPEPDKSKPIKSVDREEENLEITVDDIMERIKKVRNAGNIEH
jgi:hypothetical protein